MKAEAGRFRAEFHDTNPRGQTDAAHYRQCCMMVGAWYELMEAIHGYRQMFWIEIFDDTIGERLVGPIAPGEMGNGAMQ
jgi:hypothetical protein